MDKGPHFLSTGIDRGRQCRASESTRPVGISGSIESAMLELGLDPHSGLDFTATECWQRPPTLTKPNRRNGAVYLFRDGGAVLKNFETDRTFTHQPPRLNSYQRDNGVAKRANTERTTLEVSRVASRIWNDARIQLAPKDGSPYSTLISHPYLKRKRLPSAGSVRITGVLNGWHDDWLINAMYVDLSGAIWNLEGINSQGDKRPLKGGLRKGTFGFSNFGMPDASRIIIAEGFATALAIGISLDCCVVFTTGAANLRLVAEFWRKKSERARISIAADNDATGVGKRAAEEAASAVGGWRVMPTIPGERAGLDWCDVYTRYGPEELRRHWNG